jgi:hypothetical protein
MIAALALVADLRTLQLVDWTEARVRADSGQNVAFDLTTSPTATLAIRGHTWELVLTEAPFFALPDLEASVAPTILETAALELAWHSRDVQLSLTESGTYGTENTTNLRIPPATPGMAQTVVSGVSAQTLYYASTLTTLAIGYTPSRRWRYSLRGSYFAYGGVREIDRETIAFQHGEAAEASVAYSFSHRDATFLQLDGTRSETNTGPCFAQETGTTTANPTTAANQLCAPDSYIGTALVGLRHALSPASDASLAVGAGIVRARLGPPDLAPPPTDPNYLNYFYHTTYYPQASATYEYRLTLEHRRTVVRVDAELTPTVDVRDGAVDNRAQLTGTMTWLSGRLTLSGAFGAARSVGVSMEEPSTIVFASARADRRLDRHFVVSFGLSYFWQNQDNPTGGESVISSAMASLSITASTLPWRF